MGTDLREQFLSPRRLFELADAIAGEPISQLCADGLLERRTLPEARVTHFGSMRDLDQVRSLLEVGVA